MLVGLLGHEHNHPQAFPKAEVSPLPSTYIIVMVMVAIVSLFYIFSFNICMNVAAKAAMAYIDSPVVFDTKYPHGR